MLKPRSSDTVTLNYHVSANSSSFTVENGVATAQEKSSQTTVLPVILLLFIVLI